MLLYHLHFLGEAYIVESMVTLHICPLISIGIILKDQLRDATFEKYRILRHKLAWRFILYQIWARQLILPYRLLQMTTIVSTLATSKCKWQI